MAGSVLVTGATGFVGSHVLEALQRRGDVHVIAACRDKERLPDTFTGEVRQGDLRDEGYSRALVQGIDVVCHAAAWGSLWGHEALSRTLFLEPTLTLIKNARQSGVQRFVNTSTTSAAAPDGSSDPLSRGIPRSFWPHLCNIVAIENTLRDHANPRFQVVNLRLGVFAGQRYSLGVLPILVPRLKTHLVPWIVGGRTSLPITDGRDIGQSFALAAVADGMDDYEGFNIVGAEIPTLRAVIALLHEEFAVPSPHFSVPFRIAYAFAWLMEVLHPLLPRDPLVTRSIVHLMEEVHVDNRRAEQKLGYHPAYSWRESVRAQMQEMSVREKRPMRMAKPVM